MYSHDSTTGLKKRNYFRLFLLLGGAILVGLALTLVFRGGRLLGSRFSRVEPLEFKQVPEFESSESSAASFPRNRLVEVGDPPPNFLLADLDGQEIELYKLRGKPIVVNFWATWCAPCLVEMPELQAAYERYQDDGLVILALNYDEPPATVRSFFYDELDLTFTPLLDEGGLVAERFGVFNFPASFFISPDGEVAAIHYGVVVEEQLETYLSKLMANQE